MVTLTDDWRDSEAWDRFVAQQVQARFCHLFGYSVALGCYGYQPRNICFLNGGAIVGVLPATLAKSLLFGRKLVSQPFSEYGGLLLDPRLAENEVGEVFRLLKDYGRSRARVGVIEMHGNHGVPPTLRETWAAPSIPQQLAVLPLDRPVDELWRKVIKYSARKAVNQALNNGLKVEFACDERIIRTRFFPMYLESMKRLGAPPHSIDYYLGCCRAFGEKMVIVWAMKDAAPIAGLLGFSCGSRISITTTVSDPAQWHLRPNDLLHWELVKWAAETGHRFFDFGNIRYDGQMHFKTKWGCDLSEHKFYTIRTADNARARTLDSSSGAMQRMARLWSRCVPLGVGRIIGPAIRKQLAR